MSALRVLVDGSPLPDEEALAFWKRYSDWMEQHRGDLSGFARGEGLASVHPEMQGGGPVLVASRSEPQRPYGVAPKRPAAEGRRATGSVGGPRVASSAPARSTAEATRRNRAKSGERKR
jgi:hypothetical protein